MRNKRAVSEIVGALLMIALAVTGGIIVYVYSSGLIGSLQGPKVQQPYLEQIALDYYRWDCQPASCQSGNLNLTLRNTGSTQITLADFFIAANLVNQTNVVFVGCSGGALYVNSAPCRVGLHYFGLSFIQGGFSYNVRAVTKTGAIFDFTCIAGTTS